MYSPLIVLAICFISFVQPSEQKNTEPIKYNQKNVEERLRAQCFESQLTIKNGLVEKRCTKSGPIKLEKKRGFNQQFNAPIHSQTNVENMQTQFFSFPTQNHESEEGYFRNQRRLAFKRRKRGFVQQFNAPVFSQTNVENMKTQNFNFANRQRVNIENGNMKHYRKNIALKPVDHNTRKEFHSTVDKPVDHNTRREFHSTVEKPVYREIVAEKRGGFKQQFNAPVYKQTNVENMEMNHFNFGF